MADLTTASGATATAAVLVPVTTYYLSLHTADPGLTGANEVTGGSYARQAIQFASGASTNSQAFTLMPAEAGNLWIGIWTAVTVGTYKWGGTAFAVTGPVPVNATINFATGAVTAAIA